MGEKQAARRCQSCGVRHSKPQRQCSTRRKDRDVRAWVNNVQPPSGGSDHRHSHRHRHFDESFEFDDYSFEEMEKPRSSRKHHRNNPNHKQKHDDYYDDNDDGSEEWMREPRGPSRHHGEDKHKHHHSHSHDHHSHEHRQKRSQSAKQQEQEQQQRQQQSAEQLEQQKRTAEQLEMLKRTSLREFGELGKQMRRAMSMRRSGKYDSPLKMDNLPKALGRRKSRKH